MVFPNLKPSELPPGSRIDDKVLRFWTKDSENVWFLDDPHCGECAEMVAQGPLTPAEQEMSNNVWKYHDTPADEFFTDFKIISIAWEYFVAAINEISHEAVMHCCYSDPDETPEVVYTRIAEEVNNATSSQQA